mmetsp:Transcript_1619/g.2328  ORF Transcript_1619/g.2328 Transcript_1619/m.2328 type:complete len:239 (+) Transcript_1619:340-1056(+)
MISIIGVIVTDDHRWAALRQVTLGTAILVCGFYVIYCLARLRNYISKSILANSITSQNTKDKQPLNYSSNGREHDRKDIVKSPTSKDKYTNKSNGGSGEPNDKNFSLHTVVSGGRQNKSRIDEQQHRLECFEEPQSETSVKMKPLQTISEKATKRRLMRMKQETYARNRITCLLISASIIVPITGLSALAFTLTILQRDTSVSEEREIDSRNYSAGGDLGLWFLVIGNLYFLFYTCKN